MTTDLTQDDFISGLLAVLVRHGFSALSIRGDSFYRAIESSFEKLEEIADQYNVCPRFAVLVDPIHQDSPVVRQAISGAVLRDIVSLDNPEYQDLRFKFGPAEADEMLNRLPGGPELYERLAAEFMERYPYVAV